MQSYQRVLILGLFFLVWSGCASQKNGSRSDQQNKKEQMKIASNPGEPVPPDNCRVIATVLEIDTQNLENGSGPCSRVPCLATVRIDSIIGYGSAFQHPLSPEGKYTVKFNFTTRPSRELFPNLEKSLPEVNVGMKFQADLSAMESLQMGTENTGSRYIIYTYKVIK